MKSVGQKVVFPNEPLPRPIARPDGRDSFEQLAREPKIEKTQLHLIYTNPDYATEFAAHRSTFESTDWPFDDRTAVGNKPSRKATDDPCDLCDDAEDSTTNCVRCHRAVCERHASTFEDLDYCSICAVGKSIREAA